MIQRALLTFIGDPHTSQSATEPFLERSTFAGTGLVALQPVHLNSQRHTCFAPTVPTDFVGR